MVSKKRMEFESVEPFDIIWAKRDAENNEVFDEEKSYEGSYLIVGRDVDKLYCIRGGHKIKDYYNPYIVFSRLTKNREGEEKIIYYVNIDIKVIDYNKFINFKSRLNVEEKRDLVCSLKQQRIINDRAYYDIDLSIKVGDIIKKDKLYLVICRNNEELDCIEINDDRDLKNSFYINDIKNINYKDVKIFNINKDYEFINKISSDLLKKILYKYKEENYKFINYLNKKRNIKIGLLIELNDILYYVYNIIEDNLYCFTIECDIKENYDITINNEKYRIDLDNIEIIKIADNFKPICFAYNKEIENIKNFIENKNKIKKLLK